MNSIKSGLEGATACFQFTSNSIQLAASFEILEEWKSTGDFALHYYWLGASTRYPSRMARGLDNFSILKRFPASISNALDSLNLTHLQKRLRVSESQESDMCLKEFLSQLRGIETVQEFSKIEFQGISPGGALANSFVYESGRRDFNFEHDQWLVSLLLESYLQVYFGVKKDIEFNNIKRTLIYNGRFLHERATWDACKSLGIDTFLFETTRNRFHLRKNEGFHDRIINQNRMKELWISKSKEFSKSDLIQIGSRYFSDLESKRNRFYQLSVRDTKETFKAAYFVFYSNSDDEAVGFWDSWTEPFMEQVKLIESLQNFFDKRGQEHLYIRLHPNLATKSLEERERWKDLRDTSFSTIIAPEESISSYDLLKGSKGVISYGSTIGIEAAFHCIPSAILADCWYDELDVADKLSSLDEIYEWIDQVDIKHNHVLIEKRKERALIRGLWLELSGTPFKNCTLHELGWGAWEVESFKETKVSRSKLLTYSSIFANRLKRKRLGLNP